MAPAEFLQCATTGFDLHSDPGFQVDPGRRLEGIAEPGSMLVEVDLLGQIVAMVESRVYSPNNPVFRRVFVDRLREVDRADPGCRLERSPGDSLLTGRVELVEIEAGRLPILMDSESKIDRSQLVDHGPMGDRLDRGRMQVVTIEVEPIGVFTGILVIALRIEQGEDGPGRTREAGRVLEQPKDRLRTGRLIAMDARGNVDVGTVGFSGPGKNDQIVALRGSEGSTGEAFPGRSVADSIDQICGGIGQFLGLLLRGGEGGEGVGQMRTKKL